ncbi:hypothetical protein SAMN05443270_2793 [Lacrimispora sphenoides]|jgi:hypothetical protein|uniref:hypothetical protein n=1 Tax=Lacrimispora sphenoides TaxID=29370 RepID=UPI0008BB9A50|nr:hypothetical protein [Lacrimispora sphenoides]SEU04941.1 hypothetical protein SAMN05443270_2793 [Lacrimispora sphenoides]
MNISKNKGLSLVIVFILLAVYNLIAFVLPFNRGGMFWTGYVFSMAAILLTASVGFYAFGREGLRSKVYGCTLLSLVWCYLIAQLIIGVLEMILADIPFQYGFVLNAVLFGACMIGLIATNIAKGEVERIDLKVKGNVFYIKSLQTDIENLVSKAPDKVTKKMLKNLAEAIRYSDPMSNPQLATIENKIESKIAGLTDAITTFDSSIIKSCCDELQQLISDRNRKCKTMK